MNQSPVNFNHSHQTHLESIIKFIALVLFLASYVVYMSFKYDASTGIGLALLTWSFFVLCTPVADGGFVVAFPVRLLFGVKMAITQGVVWVLAVLINLYMLNQSSDTYELTFITQLLHQVLTQPYPYWGILIISLLGTFLSIYFGDEMMDVTTHQNRDKHHKHGFKYRIILVLGLSILTVVAYYQLLSSLNVVIPD